MKFGITYSEPVDAAYPRLHRTSWLTRGGKIMLFDSQRKAYKHLIRMRDETVSYAVEPFHDLNGRFTDA